MKVVRVHYHGSDAPQGAVPIIHRTDYPSAARSADYPEQDLREDADLQVSTSSHRCQHRGAHFYSHGILSEDG